MDVGLAPWLLHGRLVLGLALYATWPVKAGLAKSRARTTTLFSSFSLRPWIIRKDSNPPTNVEAGSSWGGGRDRI